MFQSIRQLVRSTSTLNNSDISIWKDSSHDFESSTTHINTVLGTIGSTRVGEKVLNKKKNVVGSLFYERCVTKIGNTREGDERARK